MRDQFSIPKEDLDIFVGVCQNNNMEYKIVNRKDIADVIAVVVVVVQIVGAVVVIK